MNKEPELNNSDLPLGDPSEEVVGSTPEEVVETAVEANTLPEEAEGNTETTDETIAGSDGHSADVRLVVVDTLGTDTDNNFTANVFLKLRSLSLVLGKLEGVGTECNVKTVSLLVKSTCYEVHLRCTDEACNEEVNGRIIEVLRSVNPSATISQVP